MTTLIRTVLYTIFGFMLPIIAIQLLSVKWSSEAILLILAFMFFFILFKLMTMPRNQNKA